MLQRRYVEKPELDSSFLLITEPTKRGQVVYVCNALALQRGTRNGMTLNEARTFAKSNDRLIVEPVDQLRDQQKLVELASTCERFSYCIGIEEDPFSECLFMDATGIAHFFSGEQSLAQELDIAVCGQKYDVRIAIGNTMGAAWAAAHYLAAARRPVVLGEQDITQLDLLPLQALRLPPDIARKLKRLGITTIKQLSQLDRIAIARRLGNEVLQRLDQLHGRCAELITPCRPSPQYSVSKRLEDAVAHPQLVEQLYVHLLQQLLEKLQPRLLGIRQLLCNLTLEDHSTMSIDIRMCDCTADEQHIVDLLRLKWEQVRLKLPLIAMEMNAVEVEPLEVNQQAFFADESREQMQQYKVLINRLSSRLGDRAVVLPSLMPNPVPERSVQLCVPAEQSKKNPISDESCFHALDRPTVLFAQPRTIEVIRMTNDGFPALIFFNDQQWKIINRIGPERVEANWFDQEYIRRDYYRIETESGQWLWVYCRLQDSAWFWHGEW
jgi:protein ImuB